MTYISCQLIIIALVIGLAGAVTFAFRRIVRNRAKEYLPYIRLAFTFWLFAIALLTIETNFTAKTDSIYNLVAATFIPILLIVWLMRTPSFRRLLQLMPPHWLIRVQGFRLLLSLTFWLGYRGNFIPMQLTFEWLNQDIIVGLTSLIAGSLFFGRRRFLRREALLWNFFGMLSLINIYVLIYFSFPSSEQVFRNLPDSSFLMEVPFIWIPGFLLPFALAAHLFSIQQLFLSR